MTKILLVRHGQSEWNAQGRWQGQADPPLSPAGREEALLAAESMADFTGLFFASTLIRARQTAEIIATEVGAKTDREAVVHLEPDMREIDVGDFSGLTHRQIEEQMPEAWASLQAGALDAFPAGETREHFRQRILSALLSISARHPNDEILLVTHGGAIASIERHLGAHPGVGVSNLEGRWFEVDGSSVQVVGDRVKLAGDQDS